MKHCPLQSKSGVSSTRLGGCYAGGLFVWAHAVRIRPEAMHLGATTLHDGESDSSESAASTSVVH